MVKLWAEKVKNHHKNNSALLKLGIILNILDNKIKMQNNNNFNRGSKLLNHKSQWGCN